MSKHKHFKTKTHGLFVNSIKGRYIILNPNFDDVDEIIRRCVNK